MASRILAICSTYDTMTAREGYRSPMAPQEAMDELRHAAGNGQLDAELVESFIALLEREGPTFAQDADFETELEFERRVRQMAEPRAADRHAAPAAQPAIPSYNGWRSDRSGPRAARDPDRS